MDWKTCSWYFWLVHIEKHKVWEPSIYASWGHFIHKTLQKTLQEGNEKENAKYLIRVWQRYCRMYKLQDEVYWAIPGALAISKIRELFKKEFGEFEILNIEELLFLPIEGHPQKFKGYIDVAFLRLEDGRVIIADFKTCNSAFFFNKYRDKYKDYQLTLYKHFYCKKYDVDPKEVETYFITVERYRKAKKPLAFTRVTSGPKKVRNALSWLYGALKAISDGTWIPNRGNCFKWGDDSPCVFYNTPLCPK